MRWKIHGNKSSLYQWDVNQKIVLYDVHEKADVHFAHFKDKQALVCKMHRDEGTGNLLVNIPNILLQTAEDIQMYLMSENGDMKSTVSAATIGVKRREMPADYVYEETEIISIENMTKLIDELGERLTAEVNKTNEELILIKHMMTGNADSEIKLIRNQDDFDKFIEEVADKEGNIILTEDESIIVIISESLNDYEKGIYVLTQSDFIPIHKTDEHLKEICSEMVEKWEKIADENLASARNLYSKANLSLKEVFIKITGVANASNQGLTDTRAIFDIETDVGLVYLRQMAEIDNENSVYSAEKSNTNYFHAKILGGCIKGEASYLKDNNSVVSSNENIIDGNVIKAFVVTNSKAKLKVGTRIEIWGIKE